MERARFDGSTIRNSIEYTNFIENNPNLKPTIDSLIIQFIEWVKNRPQRRDFCYFSTKKFPYSDSWSVDEPADVGTPEVFICRTWSRFEGQMGTTKDKFEFTGSNIETLKLIGEVFEKIGFNVFIVTFIHWRVGYDFDFEKLSDVKPLTYEDNREIHSVRICVSLN